MDSLSPQPSLLRHRSFVLFWCARTSTSGAYQMQAVAVGWQLYDLTHDPLDLGLVGLMQFFPVVVLALVIGQTADHFDRRAIAGTCQVVKAICAALFALGTLQGWLDRVVDPDADPDHRNRARLRGADAACDRAGHRAAPAIAARHCRFGDGAADRDHLRPGARRLSLCARAGGGLRALHGDFHHRLYPHQLRSGQASRRAEKALSVKTLFAGFAYIRDNPILLGAISLDLFAVLLGGVTALLPIYARDILGTGPWGLGLLRSAPAVGALSMSVFLARHAIERRAGLLMLGTVCIFGIASTVFALSTWIALSFAALIVYGAADAISVVIRQSLVQTRTPHDMLGRVMSVNSMFSGSSGTLGEFRAGALGGLDRRGALGADRRGRGDFDRACLVPAVPGAARDPTADRRDRRAFPGRGRHGGMTHLNRPPNLLS